MPVIAGKQITERFAELSSKANRIDIAVAWARPCGALADLKASSADIRIVVGISKNFTDPTTLKSLNEFAQLRIAPDDPSRIFHPKYYCFHGKMSVCWVGSANLTGGGFGGNDELIHEFELRCAADREWFEQLWANLESDPQPAIRAYEARYTPPKRPRRPKVRAIEPRLPRLVDIETWAEFVEGLRALDAFYHHQFSWDVLGETHSWLHTIRTGHEVVRLGDWAQLTDRECRILRGTKNDEEGDWALLGWVRGKGAFAVNNGNMPGVAPLRMSIREQIDQVLRAGFHDISAVAGHAMETIWNLRRDGDAGRQGIGPAAATRWLSLARPDCLVSISGASAAGLAEASGLPRQLASSADLYPQLLNWLHQRPWFNELPPDDPLEREIWNNRAALVDVFVFVPEM